MKRICQAIATSTKKQCKKKALPGSKYCFYHIGKMPLLISLILGALISLIFSELWHRSIPSEELKALNIESNERKKIAEEAEKRAQELSGQVSALEKALSDQRRELSAQLSQVQTQLEPFINLAKERYPNIELVEALSKLKNDIKNTHEIASRDIFKNPNELITNNTVYALNQWKEKYPNLLVKINLLNANTLHTEKIVNILFRFLTYCNIKSEYAGKSYIKTGRKAPISIYTSSEFKNAAVLLLEALGNYVSGEIYYEEKSENKFIEISFCGIPKFYNNGNVILE